MQIYSSVTLCQQIESHCNYLTDSFSLRDTLQNNERTLVLNDWIYFDFVNIWYLKYLKCFQKIFFDFLIIFVFEWLDIFRFCEYLLSKTFEWNIEMCSKECFQKKIVVFLTVFLLFAFVCCEILLATLNNDGIKDDMPRRIEYKMEHCNCTRYVFVQYTGSPCYPQVYYLQFWQFAAYELFTRFVIRRHFLWLSADFVFFM